MGITGKSQKRQHSMTSPLASETATTLVCSMTYVVGLKGTRMPSRQGCRPDRPGDIIHEITAVESQKKSDYLQEEQPCPPKHREAWQEEWSFSGETYQNTQQNLAHHA